MCSDVPLDYPRVGGPSTVRTGCAPRTIRRGNTQGPPKSTVDHPRLIHGKCVGISKSRSRCVNMAFRCADCESVHDLPTKLCQIIVATPVCRNHLQAMRWYRHGDSVKQRDTIPLALKTSSGALGLLLFTNAKIPSFAPVIGFSVIRPRAVLQKGRRWDGAGIAPRVQARPQIRAQEHQLDRRK